MYIKAQGAYFMFFFLQEKTQDGLCLVACLIIKVYIGFIIINRQQIKLC